MSFIIIIFFRKIIMIFKIAKDGLPFILIPLFTTLFFYMVNIRIISLLTLLITLFMLWFFRDPERNINKNPNLILSPADGKIIEITEPYKDRLFPQKVMRRISIFMSPLDVHINRAPIEGKITFSKYISGKFFPAFKPKASLENEQHWLSIKNDKYEVHLKLIAGILARRVLCKVKVGEEVQQGQKIAIIKFGSRVDIFVPTNAKILVNLNDKVKAGLSILASFK